MRTELTAEAERALSKAGKFAVRMGNAVIGTEHLLYGLAAAPGVASRVLKENKLDKDTLRFEIENYCGSGDTVLEERTEFDMSPKLEEIILQSGEEASRSECEKTGTEHILMAILKDTSCTAYHILLAAEANIQKL